MSNENAVALRVFPVEKNSEEPDVTRAGVWMPAGSKPIGAIKRGPGIGVAVLGPVVVGQRVWHPLVVVPADVAVTPLLGRRFGDPMGILVIGDEPVVVIPDYPWPEAPTPAGN